MTLYKNSCSSLFDQSDHCTLQREEPPNQGAHVPSAEETLWPRWWALGWHVPYTLGKQTPVLKIQNCGDSEVQGLWRRGFGNNNGNVWAPGISTVTMWEQSEEEKERYDGGCDLKGVIYAHVQKQPLATFGENICFDQRGKFTFTTSLPSFSCAWGFADFQWLSFLKHTWPCLLRELYWRY